MHEKCTRLSGGDACSSPLKSIRRVVIAGRSTSRRPGWQDILPAQVRGHGETAPKPLFLSSNVPDLGMQRGGTSGDGAISEAVRPSRLDWVMGTTTIRGQRPVGPLALREPRERLHPVHWHGFAGHPAISGLQLKMTLSFLSRSAATTEQATGPIAHLTDLSPISRDRC